MKIAVARDALAPALARAAALVPSRTTIPILACARLETVPDGLSIGTTDCEACYTQSVDAEVSEPWLGCVDVAPLLGFVQSLSRGSSLELVADESALTIAGDGAKARLAVLPADEFPIFTLRAEHRVTFELDAAALLGALRFVEPSANRDDRRHYLCGTYIDPEGLLVTSDGNRMAIHRFAASLPAFEGVILPLPALRLLPALLKGFADPVTLTVTPNLVTVTGGSWTLASKLVDGTYPDWRRIVPLRSKTPLVIETAALSTAVDRVAAVCRAPAAKMSGARLRLAAGALSVSAATETADAEVESILDLAAGPPDTEVGLSVRYLAEALAVLEGERVEIHIATDWGPVWVCTAGETENGVVIMPVRLPPLRWP
jgi:DNA polymerase-3 subunit beta